MVGPLARPPEHGYAPGRRTPGNAAPRPRTAHMAPRSPISASVADWLANARAYLACAAAFSGDNGPLQHDSGASFGPLAGTLVRIQARYGTLNARIQREADRLALWLLAKVNLPAGIAALLVEGLSSEGRDDWREGHVPKFRVPADGTYSLLDLTAEGQDLVFEDEAADNAAYLRPYVDLRQVRCDGQRPS